MKLKDIHIRDPFILNENGTYYLYGTRGKTCWVEQDGIDGYVSNDLENWDGPYNTQGAGLGSLNHYSKGSVCRWLFDSMCGIRVDSENRFVIAPKPGGSLTHASASYNSIYGLVESKWVKTETGYRYTVTVPANCEAVIRLPDGSEHQQIAGTVSYSTEG